MFGFFRAELALRAPAAPGRRGQRLRELSEPPGRFWQTGIKHARAFMAHGCLWSRSSLFRPRLCRFPGNSSPPGSRGAGFAQGVRHRGTARCRRGTEGGGERRAAWAARRCRGPESPYKRAASARLSHPWVPRSAPRASSSARSWRRLGQGRRASRCPGWSSVPRGGGIKALEDGETEAQGVAPCQALCLGVALLLPVVQPLCGNSQPRAPPAPAGRTLGTPKEQPGPLEGPQGCSRPSKTDGAGGQLCGEGTRSPAPSHGTWLREGRNGKRSQTQGGAPWESGCSTARPRSIRSGAGQRVNRQKELICQVVPGLFSVRKRQGQGRGAPGGELGAGLVPARHRPPPPPGPMGPPHGTADRYVPSSPGGAPGGKPEPGVAQGPPNPPPGPCGTHLASCHRSPLSSQPRAGAFPALRPVPRLHPWERRDRTPGSPLPEPPPVVPAGFDAKLDVGTFEPAACPSGPQFPCPAAVAGASVPQAPRNKALVVGGHQCQGTQLFPERNPRWCPCPSPSGPQPRTSSSVSSGWGFGAGAAVGSKLASCFLPWELCL